MGFRRGGWWHKLPRVTTLKDGNVAVNGSVKDAPNEGKAPRAV